MAGLGWIHFSNTTRKQVLKVIDLLGEKGSIDELGIGVVRNAFSNEMFSGISTIMTRARYYYTIPYLIIDYLSERQKNPIEIYMDRAETEIMMELTNKHYNNAENERIIGYTVAKRNIDTKSKNELVRKPSEIYWGGIRSFQLFKKQHSFAQLCQAINQGKYQNGSKDNVGNDLESGDDSPDHVGWQEIFHVPYIKNWEPDRISLSQMEAEHLKEKISVAFPKSFLTAILEDNQISREFLKVKEFKETLNSEYFHKLSKQNQKIISTAVQFWEILFGAHIRLNVLIQQRDQQNEHISFEQEWQDYLQLMEFFEWDSFDQDFIWVITDKYSNVKPKTRNFINNWIAGMRDKDSVQKLDELVINQEKDNKKERSKFSPTNHISYNGWVGIRNMDFRLSNVQVIVQDILSGSNLTDHA